MTQSHGHRVDEATRAAYVTLALMGINTSHVYRTAAADGAAALLSRFRAETSGPAESRAARAIDAAHKIGARVVVPGDEEWPSRLEDLNSDGPAPGAPLCLWVRGPVHLAQALQKSVTITGARAASHYGTAVATDFGQDLSYRGWTVANGGAFGIDEAALRGARTAYNGAPCLVMLASGLDHLYPSQNAAMFNSIGETDLLVSHCPPGTVPHKKHFERRAELLTAATSATVIVEAGPRSGCMSAAARGIALSRPVMAVPGPVTSAQSVGCHKLIRDGARLVTQPVDVNDHAATSTS